MTRGPRASAPGGNDAAVSWDDIFNQITRAKRQAEKHEVEDMRQQRRLMRRPRAKPLEPPVKGATLVPKKPAMMPVKPSRPKLAMPKRPPPPSARSYRSPSSRPQSARSRPQSAQSRPQSARSRPQSARSENAREAPEPRSGSRPQSARTSGSRPQSARTVKPPQRPSSAAAGRRIDHPAFSPAVGNGDVFDSTPRILHSLNFDTWDKERCSWPERSWPTQGVSGTLYDTKRKDKTTWKSAVSSGREFGMSMADVGTGVKADAAIAKSLAYEKGERGRKARQDKENLKLQLLKEKTVAERRRNCIYEEERGGGGGGQVIWVDGHPVRVGF